MLVTVTFRSKTATGTAPIVFTTDTQALRDSDNIDVLSGTTGTSYNLQSGTTSPTPNSKPPVIAPGPNAMPPAATADGATPNPTTPPVDATGATPPPASPIGGVTFSESASGNSSAFLGVILIVAALAAVAIAIVYKFRRHRPVPARLPAGGMSPYGPPIASSPYVARSIAPAASAATGVYAPGQYQAQSQAPASVLQPVQTVASTPSAVTSAIGSGSSLQPLPSTQASASPAARPQIQPSRYRSTPPTTFQPTVIRPTQVPPTPGNDGQPQADWQSPPSSGTLPR